MHFFERGAVASVMRQWLSLGMLWWLLGMLLLPTHKLYQQGVILLLWLPGVLSFVFLSDVRRAWLQPLGGLLVAFCLWSSISASWSRVGVDWGEQKIFLYVLMAANAVMALSCLDPQRLWRMLAMAGLIGGVLAWGSLFYFYGYGGRPLEARAQGLTLTSNPILASQLLGVLGILLFYLRAYLPAWLRGLAWASSLSGLLAFLLLSQSKGPWLAAIAVVILAPLWASRYDVRGAVICSVVVAGALFAWPDVLLQRGFSYRPELIQQALHLLGEAPLLGLGYGSTYSLPIAAQNTSYEHAHNLYLHIAVTLGLVGLAFWLSLVAYGLAQAWRSRGEVPGRLLCCLLCFAGVALFTDGVGPWVKPREEWFSMWLPLFLCMAWMVRGRRLEQ